MDPTKDRGEPRQDPTYYFECITLQVEDCLFRVPKSYFKSKSGVFESMLSLPRPMGGETIPEGTSDENPVRLEGVELVDFKRLLEVMYPLDVRYLVPGNLLTKVKKNEEWISVLKLSTMWDLYDIRALAVIHLTHASMSAIDRVLLARQYHVAEWLQLAYEQLMERSVMMSFDDATRVGHVTALRLYQGREEHVSRGIRLAFIVDREFGQEMEDVGAVGKIYTGGASDHLQQVLGVVLKRKEKQARTEKPINW